MLIGISQSLLLILLTIITITLLMLIMMLTQLNRQIRLLFQLQKKTQTLVASELDMNTINSLDRLREEWRLHFNWNEMDPKSKIELINVFNFFERLALGVNQGIYDEEIIKSSIGHTMIDIYTIFKEFIYFTRVGHSEEIYIELEKLMYKWEKDIIFYQSNKSSTIKSKNE